MVRKYKGSHKKNISDSAIKGGRGVKGHKEMKKKIIIVFILLPFKNKNILWSDKGKKRPIWPQNKLNTLNARAKTKHYIYHICIFCSDSIVKNIAAFILLQLSFIIYEYVRNL